jgi:pyruvate dehydrogenase E2 component (dihydrolipoamide acetyltransferase)
MAVDVVMPRLSDSMEEGTVLKWLVSVGDRVERGQPLVEIETDKANMTYEADTSGVLLEILAQEGDTLAIGEPIARIGEEGEAPSGDGAGAREHAEEQAGEEAGDGAQQPAARAQPAPARKPAAPAAQAGRAPAARAGDGRIKASPVARRMARELGVALEQIQGTGPGGRIVKADVEAAAARAKERPAAAPQPEPAAPAPQAAPAEAAPPQAPAEAPRPSARPAAPAPQPAGEAGAKGRLSVQELTRLQQTVSRRMAESKATAPDFMLSVEVDMTACVELRARLKEVSDPAPSFNDMVVKACATALREHPRVNGAYRDGRWELFSRVNVGIAVAAEDALVVPTIFDADRKSLGQIARDAREVIEKVRAGTITPPELSGGTFTVSNLGMYGIDVFTAIINPPQAAILTVGSLKKRPVVDDDGRIVARDTMALTLVCDHRILYGADGARFLSRVRELLERPLSLAL